jgi:hypothetical protein
LMHMYIWVNVGINNSSSQILQYTCNYAYIKLTVSVIRSYRIMTLHSETPPPQKNSSSLDNPVSWYSHWHSCFVCSRCGSVSSLHSVSSRPYQFNISDHLPHLIQRHVNTAVEEASLNNLTTNHVP